MSWKKAFKWVVCGLVGLAFVLMISGWVYERWARAKALREHPAPGRLVAVDGAQLHLDCRGTGSPTVVLESGMDPFGSISWSLQHDKLAAVTRTCAYDRAGIAWSQIGPNPRTGGQIASELRALLRGGGESGPFVVVGHSMGGLYARIFTGAYRDEVAGLVLIESSHPEQFERMTISGGFRPPPRLLIRAATLLRGLGVMRFVMPGELDLKSIPESRSRALKAVSASSIATVLSEFGEIRTSFEQASQVDSLGAMPLLVVAIGEAPDAARIPGIDQAQANAGHAQWVELQSELAELSSVGELIEVPDPMHYLQFSQPDAVVDAIASMVERVR